MLSLRSLRFICATCVIICCLVVYAGSKATISTVYASEDFTTTLHTNYLVEESGQTVVTHTFEITNHTPTLYIKQYALKLSSGHDLTQVTATSNGKNLNPNVVQTDNAISIGLSFPDQVVGENKVRKFTISYRNPHAALITGQVLEVHVPQLASDQLYDAYSVTLRTPARYGEPTRVTPANPTITQQDSQIITTFSNLDKQAVSALFGKSQIFSVQLQYHLVNQSSSQATTQIALPPDTQYQTLQYQAIEPPPTQLERDQDGNWIATYLLEPSSTLLVKTQALIKISLENSPQFVPPSTTATSYLNAQSYWEKNDPAIASLAQELGDVRNIYRRVIDTLTYTELSPDSLPERLGAVKSLAEPTLATCQEYTDLFIALARAQGIPSRRLTGYAYTQNDSLRPLSLLGDVLHAWPEYFDSQRQQWIPVDPTWEDTTGGVDYFDQFDLNHLVFAINGSSSTLPFPAGSYKPVDQTTKDVTVEFAQDFPELSPHFSLQLQPVYFFKIPIPGQYTLHIINTTGQAWYTSTLDLNSNNAVGLSSTRENFEIFLPFETKTIPIRVYTKQGWGSSSYQVQTEFTVPNYDTISHTFTVTTFPLSYQATVVIAAMGAGGIILTLFTGSVLVRRRRR